jgi:hypothetical protein
MVIFGLKGATLEFLLRMVLTQPWGIREEASDAKQTEDAYPRRPDDSVRVVGSRQPSEGLNRFGATGGS